MQNPLLQQIDAIAKEKGVEPEVIITAVQDAIEAAARKRYKNETLRAKFNTETGQVAAETFVNQAAVLVYGNAQKLLNLITGYSPVDALSTGRMITWGRLVQAVVLVLFVAGGLFSAAGIYIFTRRELAAPL